MKITILNGDNSLGIDNVFHIGLDFSQVPDEVNAVQWDNDSGVIEYLNSTGKPDEPIDELPFYFSDLKAQWDARELEAQIEKAKYLESLEKAKQVAAEIANTQNSAQTPPTLFQHTS